MKIIDKNGRLFGKISVIDVIVILVVAVMAVALYLKTNTMTHTSTATSNQTINYQVYARGVAESVEDVLRLEDQLFDEDRGNSGCLGVIKNIEILPGTLPRILARLSHELKVPLIAGGLLEEKGDIVAALGAGALCVSASDSRLWDM